MTQAIAALIAEERRAWSADHPGVRPPVIRLDDDGAEHVAATQAPPGSWRTRLAWTALYLFFDEDGGLLYVGISVRPEQRLRDHVRSEFWPQAAAVAVRWRTSRTAALLDETWMIDRHSPPFNRARQVERDTRAGHELMLLAGDAVGRHPREGDMRGERYLVGGGQCWACATDYTLSAALAGRDCSRWFAPFRPSIACSCKQ